ncbi:MAG TPA: hypothetical protein PK788_06040 [Gemmatimonadaceae bacterium]|nr:hypothetical protein [Gemmatimonadaceae bacterium]HRQ78494.1 hypothetical protein [Gemmatimonadaceae bacterium]
MTSAELCTRLGAALSDSTPAASVRRLLREAIVARDIGTVREQALDGSWWLVERLDAIGDSDERLLEASRAVHRLLDTASSERSILSLRELVVDGTRLHQVLTRYFDGRVSRTQLLSFIAEQHWESAVKDTLCELSQPELRDLLDATGKVDIERLEQLLQI